eukprot:GEMP01010863.1.p1 GENE.GEMP01010863.1~~GEMP01010863.1.p1  ORF type:complete len:1067 (+),score=281.88 GEMP01010863.1:22-3201(+)
MDRTKTMDRTKLSYLRGLPKRQAAAERGDARAGLCARREKACNQAPHFDPWAIFLDPAITKNRATMQMSNTLRARHRRVSAPTLYCQGATTPPLPRCATPPHTPSRALRRARTPTSATRTPSTSRPPSRGAPTGTPAGQDANTNERTNTSTNAKPHTPPSARVDNSMPTWTINMTRASTPNRSARQQFVAWTTMPDRTMQPRAQTPSRVSRTATPTRARTPNTNRARTPTSFRPPVAPVEIGPARETTPTLPFTPFPPSQDTGNSVPTGRACTLNTPGSLLRALRTNAWSPPNNAGGAPATAPDRSDTASCKDPSMLQLVTRRDDTGDANDYREKKALERLQCGFVSVTLRQAALDRKRRRSLVQSWAGISRGKHRAFSAEAEKVVTRWLTGQMSGRMAWVQFCLAVELVDCEYSLLASLIGAPAAALPQGSSPSNSLYRDVFCHSPQQVREEAWIHLMEEGGNGSPDEIQLTLKRITMRAKGRCKEEYCRAQIWRLLLEERVSNDGSASDCPVTLTDKQVLLSGDELVQSVRNQDLNDIRQDNDDLEMYLALILSSKKQLSNILKDLERSNHFAVLGVSPESSDEEVKRAFIKLARNHHPDKGGDADTFTDIHQAYQSIIAQREGQQQPAPDSPVQPSDTTKKSFANIKSMAREAQKTAESCSKIAVVGLQATQSVVRTCKKSSANYTVILLKTANSAIDVAETVASRTKSVGNLLRLIGESTRHVCPSLVEISVKVEALADVTARQSASLKDVAQTFQQLIETFEAKLLLFPNMAPDGIAVSAERLGHHIRGCANTTTDSAEASIEVAQCISEDRDNTASDTSPKKRDKMDFSSSSSDSSDEDEAKQDEKDLDGNEPKTIEEKLHNVMVGQRIRLGTLVRQADAALRLMQSKVWQVVNASKAPALFDVKLEQKEFLFNLCAEVLDDACVAYDNEVRKVGSKDKDGWINVMMSLDGPMGFLQKISHEAKFTIHPDLRVQLCRLARAVDVNGLRSLMRQSFERLLQTLNWAACRPCQMSSWNEESGMTQSQSHRFMEFQSQTLRAVCDRKWRGPYGNAA